MSVINTNILAKIESHAIKSSDRGMGIEMERLATVLRIKLAKDDAAGLAIAARVKGSWSGLEMTAKNANDTISMLKAAEGVPLEISNSMIHMRNISVQSASGTYSDSDREALDLEFSALMRDIDT
tara:strand:- start:985 stop:1359 length:375 start_codon:yes stop_codon:yes gene_type:complete